MIDLDEVPTTYAEAVEALAAWHQDGDVTIFHVPDPDQKTVRFVEVSKSFSDDRELRPIAMGASVDFPFPSSILQISKADWQRVKNDEKQLPDGWNYAQMRELPVYG